MKRLNPLNDVAFKVVFSDEGLLESLLNSILDFEVSNIILINKEIIPDTKDGKIGVLDINAKTAAGEKINIEVQLTNQYNIVERTLFYWSKLFTSELKKSNDYRKLPRTITINLLGFNLDDGNNFHSNYGLKDKFGNKTLTDKLEIHFIETFKFLDSIQSADINDKLHRWLVFFNGRDQKLLEEVISVDENIAKAEEKLHELNLDKDLKVEYDKREKEIIDEKTRMRGAEEEGMRRGVEQGIKKGVKQGVKQGIEQSKKDVIKNMRENGFTDTEIERITGISPSDFE